MSSPLKLPAQALLSYKARTFRSLPELRLRNHEEAIRFVNQRGFIFFWPVQGFVLPSLWVATAGDRPVADAHDDPGHICWQWKDDLLGKKAWYYARVLRGKNTFIALDILPYFYALSPNCGDPEHDYLEQYRDGLLSLEARQVYEALIEHGPLDTLTLRRAAHLNNPESTSRFERALGILQAQFRVLPVGVAEVGAWHYAFVYDVTHRHFPELIAKAQEINEYEARARLLQVYLRSVGAVAPQTAQRLFGWTDYEMASAVRRLVQSGWLVQRVMVPGQGEDWIACPDVFAHVKNA